MRVNFFFKTVIVTCAAFTLSYIFYLYSGNSFQDKFSDSWYIGRNYQTVAEAVKLQNIDTLTVDVSNADVYIKKSSQADGQIRLAAPQSEAGLFSAEKQDKTLVIKLDDENNTVDNALEILAPDNVKNIIINDKSGNIKITSLNLNTLSANLDSGNVKVKNTDIDNATITVSSGNIEMEGLIKSLNAKTVDGNISVDSGFEQPELSLKTTSGNIAVKVAETIHAKLNLSATQGLVNNDGIPPDNNATSTITAHTETGNIVVEPR